MELAVWLTYLLTTFVLALTPGPGVFSCLSAGVRHGFRIGVWNCIGMQLANLLLVAAVSLGLGALLFASEALFTAVKWLGVAYLVYLGIASWRAPAHGFEVDDGDHARTRREVFWHGFLVNATNPKGIFFFAAILPQFIDVARPRLAQYGIFASTTFVVDVIVMGGYTLLAARVLGLVRDPRRIRWVNRGIGSLFVAAGVALASFRRIASTV
jgi:homoserine/homoserine lactone efflux protein